VDTDSPPPSETHPAGIVATDLTVRYQGTPEPAIRDVSCEIAPGAGLCVTGGEGAGKSTLIRALVGLVPPVRGSVTVLGGSPRLPEVRRQVGYAPDRLPFPRGMRVCEALRLIAAIRRTDASTGDALERVGLPPDDRRVIAGLDLGDLDAIARIAYVREFEAGEELIVEGAPAEQLYLFLKGKAQVKMREADGSEVAIDELGPGELLGWGAVMEPHIYTGSAWTTEPSELIVIKGKDLRELGLAVYDLRKDGIFGTQIEPNRFLFLNTGSGAGSAKVLSRTVATLPSGTATPTASRRSSAASVGRRRKSDSRPWCIGEGIVARYRAIAMPVASPRKSPDSRHRA